MTHRTATPVIHLDAATPGTYPDAATPVTYLDAATPVTYLDAATTRFLPAALAPYRARSACRRSSSVLMPLPGR